jgi:hypothetical protein
MNPRTLATTTWVLVLAAATPTAVQAGYLGCKNDLNVPVIVQVSATVNGRVARGQPHVINPRESAWDPVNQIGVKNITITDAQQRVIFSGAVNYVGKDLYFSIQLDNSEKPPKVKLYPIALPVVPKR